MKGKTQVNTNLVGQYVAPTAMLKQLDEGRAATMPRLWQLKPNKAGAYFGEIVAVWLEEGNLKAQLVGPEGDTQAITLRNEFVTIHKTSAEIWIKV